MILREVRTLLLAFCLLGCAAGYEKFPSLENIKSNTPLEVQEKSAQDLIARIVPEHASSFQVKLSSDLPLNTFEILKDDDDTLVQIRASDGISASKGFHHYLKYYLDCHVSWSGDQLGRIPSVFPSVNISFTSASRFIYHQNVCTWSYSFAWWKWSDWRRHVDWMAMMGISLTIAPIQEEIWARVYSDLGLTEEEYLDHFAGPAFQAWQRMGNIRAWGGPLTKTYRQSQLLLQKQILEAQRNLGMTVALPAFAGHVPVALQRIYPNVTMTQVARWNRFDDKYCCPLFIDPNEPLFQEIGQKFLKAIVEEYGTDHVYFSDPFNEIDPLVAEGEYLAKTSSNIYRAMTSVDAKAVWLLQGWMFVHSALFWKKDLQRAFLTAVPPGSILVLDLQSDQYPQYENSDSYFGQPFIWCMLHNFGGTLGMQGSAGIVNSRIRLARAMDNSSMIGVGITPEGINQNYVMYELALERGWMTDDFDLDDWFQTYSKVRYGIEDPNLSRAWTYLKNSVYSFHGLERINGKYSIARRPSLKLSPWIWYNGSDVKLAWENMLNEENLAFLEDHSLLQHDLVDVTRQYLQITFDHIYVNIVKAFENKDSERLRGLSDLMLQALDDMEEILKTNENFLLGRWLESAKGLAVNSLEAELNEFNARNQITAWGPKGEIIDYATKQWSGVVGDFFKPRWSLFLGELSKCLAKNRKFNENKFRRAVFKTFESPFSTDRKIYPTNTEGNSFEVARKIHAKWNFYESKHLFGEEVLFKAGTEI